MRPTTLSIALTKSGTRSSAFPLVLASSDKSLPSSPRPPSHLQKNAKATKWSQDSVASSVFHRLLLELADVHERQVEELQKELEKNRSLPSPESSTSAISPRLPKPFSVLQSSTSRLAKLEEMGNSSSMVSSVKSGKKTAFSNAKYSIMPDRQTVREELRSRLNHSMARQTDYRQTVNSKPSKLSSPRSFQSRKMGARQMPVVDPRNMKSTMSTRSLKSTVSMAASGGLGDDMEVVESLFADLERTVESCQERLRCNIDATAKRQEELITRVLSTVEEGAVSRSGVSSPLSLDSDEQDTTPLKKQAKGFDVKVPEDLIIKPQFEAPSLKMPRDKPLPPPGPPKGQARSKKTVIVSEQVSTKNSNKDGLRPSLADSSEEQIFLDKATNDSSMFPWDDDFMREQKKAAASIFQEDKKDGSHEATKSNMCGASVAVRAIWMEEAVASEQIRSIEKSMDVSQAVAGNSQYQGNKHSVRSVAMKESPAVSFLIEGDERMLPLYPASPVRILWNIIGLFAIMFDAIAMPLQVFEMDKYIFMDVMAALTLAYWNLDILMNFLVGYYDGNGNLVMTYWPIAKNYFRAWFTLDLLLVACDWTVLLFNSIASNFFSSFRFFRFFRIVRLLRLAKVQGIVFQLQDCLVSNYVGIYITIFKTLLSILMTIHFVACLWYGLGTRISDDDEGWISQANFDGTGALYRYTTSYHWALAQFGVGEVNLEPGTSLERIFAILVGLFALLAQSTLISSVTGAATQLRNLRKGPNMEFAMLRRFCKHNQINPDLTQRILKYLRHAEKVKSRGIAASDLDLFRLLSEPLRNELQLAIYKPHLLAHPLFKRLCVKYTKAMMTVCAGAISNDFLASEDLYFCFGETAQGMTIVLEGLFTYRKCEANNFGPDGGVSVGAKQWLSEQALWLSVWTHRGDLVASRESEVILVNSDIFGEISKNFAGAFRVITTYARAFVSLLMKTPEDAWSDFEDPEKIDGIILDEDAYTRRGKWSWMEALKIKMGLATG